MSDKTLQQMVLEKAPEIVAEVEDKMIDQYKNGVLASEASFIAGAATVMLFLGMPPDEESVPNELLPPRWFFNIVGNRSLVAQVMRERELIGEKEKKRMDNKIWHQIYQRAKLDELVRFAWTVYKSADLPAVRKSRMTPSQTLTWFRQEARILLDDMMEEVDE